MVLLEAGKLPQKNYVNIWNLSELRGIEVTDSHVTLGALTTYTEIQDHETLRAEFPMLCQAAISYVEALPWEDSLKRSSSLHLQLGNGS